MSCRSASVIGDMESASACLLAISTTPDTTHRLPSDTRNCIGRASPGMLYIICPENPSLLSMYAVDVCPFPVFRLMRSRRLLIIFCMLPSVSVVRVI